MSAFKRNAPQWIRESHLDFLTKAEAQANRMIERRPIAEDLAARLLDGHIDEGYIVELSEFLDVPLDRIDELHQFVDALEEKARQP